MRRAVTGLVLAGMLMAGGIVAQQKKQQEIDLQAAMRSETVDGDLKGAIKQYGAIVAKYTKDRGVAAMALVHMAECYQKMGDTESRKIYERVLREYADQKEAVTMARARLGATPRTTRQTNTLVWGGSKVDNTGTISPDGRYLSFVDWETGDLALREIATGVDRRLTNKGTWEDSSDFAENSAISKDGRQIAYTWFKKKDVRAELRFAHLTGEFNPRRLYDNPDIDWIVPFDWSPDGKSLAVQINRKDRTAQIGLITVPEGSLRVLKSVDWRGAQRMFFSPDGKHLGYDLPQSDATQQRDVFVLSVDGTREIRAVAYPSHDTVMGWFPDGKWLLFASDRAGSRDLWGLPFAAGAVQGSPELLKSDIPPFAHSMGVTRSGALYYGEMASQNSTKIQIASFNFAAGRFLSAPTDLTQDYAESNKWATWSPDGNRLAYVSQRGPAGGRNNPMLAIRSMDTGQVRELSLKLSSFRAPRWGPDGRSFLIWGTDFKGRNGIHQIDVQSGDVTTLVLDQPGEPTNYPAWSPDGKGFYFTRSYESSGVSAFIHQDLATGKQSEVIRRPALGGAHLSPDARYIVTDSVDPASNSRVLLLIPLAGGSPRELIKVASEAPPEELKNANKGVHYPVMGWAQDSQSVVVWKTHGNMTFDQSGELWQVPIDGGEPKKLEAKLKMSLGGLSVHPDRRRVAYTVRERVQRRNSGIWALENFLPVAAGTK